MMMAAQMMGLKYPVLVSHGRPIWKSCLRYAKDIQVAARVAGEKGKYDPTYEMKYIVKALK